MLTKDELRTFESTIGFNIWQVEKDYLQHLFLLFLSRHTKDQLVFKGGTALQKVYGLNRFSIDLDFSLQKELKDKEIEKVAEDIKNFGFDCECEKEKENFGITFKLKINGPLYDGTDKSKSTLRIEISKREKVLFEPEIKEIVPVYPDLHPYPILVMQLKEILAEKIRAIIVRTKARDVYDLWFLLRKNVKIDEKLINNKLSFYRKTFKREDLISSIKSIGRVWGSELKPLVTFLPDFKLVLKEIIEKV